MPRRNSWPAAKWAWPPTSTAWPPCCTACCADIHRMARTIRPSPCWRCAACATIRRGCATAPRWPPRRVANACCGATWTPCWRWRCGANRHDATPAWTPSPPTCGAPCTRNRWMRAAANRAIGWDVSCMRIAGRRAASRPPSARSPSAWARRWCRGARRHGSATKPCANRRGSKPCGNPFSTCSAAPAKCRVRTPPPAKCWAMPRNAWSRSSRAIRRRARRCCTPWANSISC